MATPVEVLLEIKKSLGDLPGELAQALYHMRAELSGKAGSEEKPYSASELLGLAGRSQTPVAGRPSLEGSSAPAASGQPPAADAPQRVEPRRDPLEHEEAPGIQLPPLRLKSIFDPKEWMKTSRSIRQNNRWHEEALDYDPKQAQKDADQQNDRGQRQEEDARTQRDLVEAMRKLTESMNEMQQSLKAKSGGDSTQQAGSSGVPPLGQGSWNSAIAMSKMGGS